MRFLIPSSLKVVSREYICCTPGKKYTRDPKPWGPVRVILRAFKTINTRPSTQEMLHFHTLMHPHVAVLVYPSAITDSLDREMRFHHAFQFAFHWQIIVNVFLFDCLTLP